MPPGSVKDNVGGGQLGAGPGPGPGLLTFLAVEVEVEVAVEGPAYAFEFTVGTSSGSDVGGGSLNTPAMRKFCRAPGGQRPCTHTTWVSAS